MDTLITIFHLTSHENADAIMRSGDCYGGGDGHQTESIWFSDRPLWRGCILDLQNVPQEVAVLSLSMSEELAAKFEVAATNHAQRYREWQIPAAVVNASALARLSEEPSVSHQVERHVA
jgi:hypothetical protein